jgi:hypothetical protein
LGDDGDGFTWCGRLIAQRDDGIAVTCPNTAAKLRPIPLTMSRKKYRDALATDAEITQLRSILGSLNWVARVWRPDIAYQLSALQTVQKKAVVQDLIDCNSLMRHVQATPEIGLFYKCDAFDFDHAVVLSISDASHAADAEESTSGKTLGHRSQSGRLICLAGSDFVKNGSGVVHPIEYHSNIDMIRRFAEAPCSPKRSLWCSATKKLSICGACCMAYDMTTKGTTGRFQLWTPSTSTSSLTAEAWKPTYTKLEPEPQVTRGWPLTLATCAKFYGANLVKKTATHSMGSCTKRCLHPSNVGGNQTMVADCLTKKRKCEQMETLQQKGTLAFDMNKENSKKAMARARNKDHASSNPSFVCRKQMS